MPANKFLLLLLAFSLLFFPKIALSEWTYDKTPPETTYSTPSCTVSTRSCTFTFSRCTDVAGTCQKTYTSFSAFTIPTSGTERNPTVTGGSFSATFADTSDRIFYYRSVDSSGNIETTRTLPISFNQATSSCGNVRLPAAVNGSLPTNVNYPVAEVPNVQNASRVQFYLYRGSESAANFITEMPQETIQGTTYRRTLDALDLKTNKGISPSTPLVIRAIAVDSAGNQTSCGTITVLIALDGDWGDWSGCSETCGGGGENTRLCNDPAPANGGLQCRRIDGTRGLVETQNNCAVLSCASPWIQTSGGDVHSNTNINAQPAP